MRASPVRSSPAPITWARRCGIQCQAVIVTLAWSAIGATVLYLAIDKLWGFRASLDTEHEGLDIAEHGERAYHY